MEHRVVLALAVRILDDARPHHLPMVVIGPFELRSSRPMVKKNPDPIFYACAPTVFVRDLDVARQFYTEVLQFNELRRIGDRNILLSAPAMTLLLRRRETDAPVEPTTMLLGLMVHDITTAMNQLSQKRVEFEGDVVETPLARVAFFSDPDGTSLYLCQWLQR